MENLKIVKIVDKGSVYKDKNGKEHTRVNYYVVFNNKFIAIRPCFSNGYVSLDMICETIINGK